MKNFKDIGDGVFVGPQPAQQDLNEAKLLGIQTVIDLRMPNESKTSNAEMTRLTGLGYLNVPVDKTALTESQIDELEHAMGTMPGPYLLHCATGARAVLLLLLSRARQMGWSAQHTLQEARAIGFNLEDSDLFASFVARVTAH